MFIFPLIKLMFFLFFFLNQGTCEIVVVDKESRSVCAATVAWI